MPHPSSVTVRMTSWFGHRRADGDVPARRRVLDRVPNYVDESLLYADRVAVHRDLRITEPS